MLNRPIKNFKKTIDKQKSNFQILKKDKYMS